MILQPQSLHCILILFLRFSFGYLMGVIASVMMNVCILVIWGSARNENINTNIALLEKKNNKLTL